MVTEHSIGGYTIDVDLLYEGERHVWVRVLEEGRVRIGLDPLGVETMGDLVQLFLAEPGTTLRRGDPFGTIEAAKFVGPLTMPVSGEVITKNPAAETDPGLIARDPLGDGWLLELQPSDPAEFDALVAGRERIVPWFEGKVAEYADKGMLAE